MDAMIHMLVLVLFLAGLYSVLGVLSWGLEQLPMLLYGRRHRPRRGAQLAADRRPPRPSIANASPLVPSGAVEPGPAALRRRHETRCRLQRAKSGTIGVQGFSRTAVHGTAPWRRSCGDPRC
jgi:hypothetical protein